MGRRRAPTEAPPTEDSHSDTDIAQDFEPDSGSEADSQIVIDFECYRPRSQDAMAFRTFLSGFLDTTPFYGGQLATLLAQQEFVGSVLRVVDEDDVLSFISCLNIGIYRNEEPVGQICQYLLRNTPKEHHQLLDNLVNSAASNRTAFIFHDRLINIPSELIVPLWERFEEELQWAVEDGVVEYDFLNLIYMTFVYTPTQETAKKGKKKNQKRTAVVDFPREPLYPKFEDEFLRQEAEISFTFNYGSMLSSPYDFDTKCERLVMVLSRRSLKRALEKASKAISVPQFDLFDRTS
ncbi:hypothetical protein RCL1_000605 [Eukaryota sp. TZLM3-RCL]